MNIGELLQLQLTMFLLMGAGFVLRKANVITPAGKKALTDLVICFILPCNIIHSFGIQLDRTILISCMQILLASIALQLLCVIISATAYRTVPKAHRMCLQFGTVCSNAGFLGNPVAEGLYGSLGLLYASVYVIPQRIVMWSVGISYFTESPNLKTLIRKVLTHPCIIAVAIGAARMISGVPLPAFLDRSISSVGSCTTPITMIYIGAVLADAGLKNLVSWELVRFSFIRLIAIPAAVLLGCWLCNADPIASGVAVVLAAMPAGTTTAILAASYHADEVFATRCVVLTTLLSMALLPLWCVVINAVL